MYKEFKQFKQILNDYDIEVTKEFRLIGEENEIREFILLFYERILFESVGFPERNQKQKERLSMRLIVKAG